MPSISSPLVSKALLLTAPVNLIAGAAALLLPDLNTALLFGSEIPLEGLGLRMHIIVWLFVFTMGLGYAVAARNPEEQTALILSGGCGKAGFALLCVEMFLNGLGTPILLAAAAFDGVLGVLFLAYSLPRIFANSPRSEATAR